ncbi:unnamed protein product [Eruca vesicaria subsp. sativa]|uniref:F-box domain-containing protein n=1 Tax=Eruca vesicaria subsp. sativa TaxID=29727 RepID=A0ABC8LND6_ERUVS|nr:unnamed protein product [Eruca vesicaria subsp. sativa]
MDSFTEDLWAMVLARLPIKISTGFKLVCKQWKSIVESPFFKNLFISAHQKSHSSTWSLMSRFYVDPEIVGHYQCDTWGLDRSLGSFIKSFLADKQQKYKYQQVSVEAYSDVGLILIHVASSDRVIYVANPVSRECVEILIHDPLPTGFGTYEYSFLWQWGLVTRTVNGVLLGYKVILIDKLLRDTKLNCLIYSSETGLWSLETLHLPHSLFIRHPGYPISLNGSLHWLGMSTEHHKVVLSIDFYTTSTGSVQCRVTPFPDLEKITMFTRFCTPFQGFLMYMNIVSVTKVDGSLDNKLCVWRLMSEGYWQLMSETSPAFTLTDNFDYLPVTVNPFDAKTAYLWSMKQERLLSFDVYNGKLVIHNQCEGSGDGRTVIPVNDPRAMIFFKRLLERVSVVGENYFIPFVLPQWLHRIPKR